ncbi:MAG: hypothetical protein LQ343_000251 [Gyalolechia ehrenbergii]|nr:MAG: hypothetical protein LQ343_000251 [Gyalolechia ehrenbergii]
MAPPTTNYAEIQQDEIEALRSIYMEQFQEDTPKVGAWNKTGDRAFRITLKPADGEHDDIALRFKVSFPATYPKSLPKLSLSFSEGIRANIKAEAEEVLRTKPRTLLGSEMIFEITTSLQDVLEHAAQNLAQKVPTLEEERANQQAVVTRQAEKAQEQKRKLQHQTSVEEEQYLAEMVEKQKAREERRRDRVQTTQEPNNSFSNEIVVDSVYSKAFFREGPVTRLWLVRHVGASEFSSFFLLLKDCYIPASANEILLKKQIQTLELKLEALTHLAIHPNVARPLAFKIERAEVSETSEDSGWNVSILLEKSGRNSLHNLLEMTGPLELSVGRAWIIQLLEALGHYHRRGMTHAAIHTHNVLLEKVETGRVIAKLSDGGYQHDLHLLRGDSLTDHAGAASIYWTSPELIKDRSNFNPATDVWSLGIVVLQLFFGLDIQSKHQSPITFLDSTNLSPSFERLVRSMFQYESKKRTSAWELVSAAFLRNDDPLFQEILIDSPTNKRVQRRGSSHNQSNKSRFTTDFVQEGRLGKGGYGSVVKVRNRLDSSFYAVKIINKCTEAALDKVLNEVRLLSQLNHPNVVRYYTAWKEVDNPSQSGYHSDSSDGTDTSTEGSEVSDLIFPRSSGGLDFIGSNNDRNFSDEESIAGETDEDAVNEDDGIVFGDDDDADDEVPNQPLHDSDGSDEEQLPRTQGRRQSSSQLEDVNNTLYIQMEYCEKQTLRDVIKSGIQEKAAEVWRYFRQILQGLAHIHSASIVHRDLKPENIFIDSNSNVRIGDFGLARPGEFLQLPTRSISTGRDTKVLQGNFTRSVGTTFYVAPEVKSSSVATGNYDDKADMFSLGIIFFEMNHRLETGMERVHTLQALCKPDSVLPATFRKDPEKAKQAQIIVSLVNHNPNLRPSSTELLRSGLIPLLTEDETMRTALRALSDSKSDFRVELINRIIADATSAQKSTANSDTGSWLKEYMYDLHGWHNPEIFEALLRKDVKDHLTSIFRRHGALEVDRPVLIPFSAHYSQHANSVCKLIDAEGTVLQMPLDLTLPNARILAKHQSPGPKTYTFGEVYRAVPSGGHPRMVGEVDFDIVSYNSLDLALREAEVIKVLDEIVDEFPSMAAVQMCYHINHSVILDAVLDACDIPSSKRPAVKEVISRLHTGEHTWPTIRSELRNPPVSVPATSVEELITFDFRDTYDKALSRLRSKIQITLDMESTFSHIEAVAIYLGRFNVKRKVYVNPLGSYNEKFYRGNILFQCVYDSKKKNVFAAGGRYDGLIKEHQLIQNPSSVLAQRGSSSRGSIANCHAVGFNLSWQDLHRSMVRYHKGSTKRTPRVKKDQEANISWTKVRRCDVLVDSFDKNLLRTTGLTVIQELWKIGVHAELAVSETFGLEHEGSNAYAQGQDILPYLYLVTVKQEGFVKVRNIAQNEEIEMRISEVITWFKGEMMHRERADDHNRKLSRHSSHPDQGWPSVETGSDVQVLMSLTKGKKTNRRAIIEEALTHCQDFVHGFADGNVQIIAVETKDDIFEGIRETRLGDADSWKKFIQHAPAGDRAYLQELQELLKSKAAKAKRGYRSAFLYNFRTGSCMWYDLGHGN